MASHTQCDDKTNIILFKGELNQVTHLKGNLLDQSQNQSLGIKDGFMDIIFLVTRLGIRPLISGQEFGMEVEDGISSST